MATKSYATSILLLFFFKKKTAYEITRRDWSSDVCSSDLEQRRDVSRGHVGQCNPVVHGDREVDVRRVDDAHLRVERRRRRTLEARDGTDEHGGQKDDASGSRDGHQRSPGIGRG